MGRQKTGAGRDSERERKSEGFLSRAGPARRDGTNVPSQASRDSQYSLYPSIVSIPQYSHNPLRFAGFYGRL
jgi:hypothetical protein